MFNNIYKGKKVLITGNTGFKGSWLSIWLDSLGAEIYGVSLDIPTSPSIFESMNLKEKVNYFKLDIRNNDNINKLMNEVQPDFLFHLAAQSLVSKSYEDPLETISTNVIGTANILNSLRFLKKKCVSVIITSDKCYNNVEWVWGYKETDPMGGKDIYSGSKGAAEIIFNSYFNSFLKQSPNVKIASARAGNVIGGGDWALDRIVPDCMRAWKNQKAVEIRSPDATRPWQHVLEPLSGYLNLAENLYNSPKLNGESFNFGPLSEYNKSVIRLLTDLSTSWDFNNKKPYKIIDNIKFDEAGLLKLNCDKALFHLGWVPVLNYNELIDFTGSWYFNFYNSKIDMYKFTLNQINKYEQLAIKKSLNWTS